MDAVLRYRGREVSNADIVLIRELIAHHPEASRRSLSKKLCEAWDWRQANGALRDMVCRGLMLALHRGGHINLPPVRLRARNPLVERRKPAPVVVATEPVDCELAELRPLEFRQVRRSSQERLFNGLIEQYHYLGYTQPVGEHLKYLVLAKDRPIACLAWSSAPRHLAPRDRFIGWSPEARRRNVRGLAYNSRFLILPWVRVPDLASHILGTMARVLSAEWERLYAHPIYYLESFIDPSRFRGTCYRAATWLWLGRTTGRGHNAPTKRATQPVKEVLGYPLERRFRERLSELGAAG